MALKTLTLLHSNDLHGDFLPTVDEGVTAGGVAQISGYVKQERAANPATLYAIAGDMFRGSVLDSEFKGISTVEIMNAVGPDIATLGNHEVDYGVPHLLFLEKYATFPIVNANMYLRGRKKRLFTSHKVITVDGMRVLFIGLVTPSTQNQTDADELIGEYIDFADPLPEVRRVCRLYQRSTIDLTVILSHLGWLEDHQLAQAIDPAWGVDLIVGGHSHLTVDEPDVVNGIPLVQLGMGSRHIGRFDLVIDTDAHKLQSYEWKSLRLTPDVSPRDEALAAGVNGLKRVVDDKYKKVVIELARQLTHPVRYRETELGDLICDMVQCVLDVHIALFPSSSLRAEELGPEITLDQMVAAIPYDGPLTIMQLTGQQIERAVHRLMRDENWADNPKFFQVSKGFCLEYDRVNHQILKLELYGKPLQKDQPYYVAMDEYHYLSSQKLFGLSHEEIDKNGRAYTVPFSYRRVALHYFSQVSDARKRAQAAGEKPEPVYAGLNLVDPALPLERSVEGRLVIHHPEGTPWL